jgi:mRNA interferase RelE/StbE
MAPMKIEISHAAAKSLDRLDAALRRRLIAAIGRLVDDPRSPAIDAQPLHGQPGVWRLRVGGWRVLYRINDQAGVVTVVVIRSRGDVYKR